MFWPQCLKSDFCHIFLCVRLAWKIFPKPRSSLDLMCISWCLCLQEWKARDPPASTVGRLTEMPTGVLLHPVSEEPSQNVLPNKLFFSYLANTFLFSHSWCWQEGRGRCWSCYWIPVCEYSCLYELSCDTNIANTSASSFTLWISCYLMVYTLCLSWLRAFLMSVELRLTFHCLITERWLWTWPRTAASVIFTHIFCTIKKRKIQFWLLVFFEGVF